MLTENNWVQSNIEEYCETDVDFVCTLVPYDFKKKTFKGAVTQTAKKIYRDIKKPLFVLLSGGADSEFVVRTFHRLKIPFTAVIVDTGMNPFENKIAYAVCEYLDIKPHIIKTTEALLVDFYLNIMFKYNRGRSMYSVPTLIALEYINSVGGFGITGDSPAHDYNIQDVAIAAHEFYGVRFGYKYTGFYYYDIVLFHATLNEIKDAKTAEEFKSQAYGTVYRKKSKSFYSNETRKIFMQVFNRTPNNPYCSLGSVKEVLANLNQWSE